MSTIIAVRIPRCCSRHGDWATLAEHLVGDYIDVPASAVIDELWRARRAGELFHLELPDALDCAELIVRQRVISATGRRLTSAPAARDASLADGRGRRSTASARR